MKLLTLLDAAERLSVSEKTLRRVIAAGELSIVRIGRLVRIREADLERFILASLRREEPACQSANVVDLGQFAFKSGDARLNALLDRERRARTRSSSKARSGAKP